MKSNRGRRRRAFLAAATLALVVAAAFRLFALQDVPPGLAQDEVLDADIAGFILEGRHALFFREGYGHEPLYHYWAAPFRVLLGDNVLSVRLPAAFLGLMLVAATIRWARRDFGAIAALVAGAGLAVSWWPIIFSRIGIRPIMEPLLLVFAVWFWPRRPVIAGLFLGAAIYSYTAARYIFVLPLALAGYLALTRPDERQRFGQLRAALVVFLVALACYVPLALTLRADPTLQQRVDQLAGPLEALRAGDFGPVLETARATLGVFSVAGDPRWTYSIPGRPLIVPPATLLFYGGLLLVLLRACRPRYALLAFWLVIALLPSALSPDAPSTVRLVGAMPVVYLLPGIALSWLWQRRKEWMGDRRTLWPGRVLVAAALALVLLEAGLTVEDGFRQWPQATETRLRYQSVLLDIARHWEPQEGFGALVVADSFFEPIDADSLRRNHGRELPARWVQAGPDLAGALVWPGEPALLYVPEFAPPPPELMALAGISGPPVYRSENAPGFAVYPLPRTAPEPAGALYVSFAGQMALTGYTIGPVHEDMLSVLTFWQVEAAPLPADLAVFVHLVGPDGALLGQHDGLDAAPALLEAGDVVVQRHLLPAPPESGTTIQLGLYQRGDGHRLPPEGVSGDAVQLPMGDLRGADESQRALPP